jgi:hypothetical protein
MFLYTCWFDLFCFVCCFSYLLLDVVLKLLFVCCFRVVCSCLLEIELLSMTMKIWRNEFERASIGWNVIKICLVVCCDFDWMFVDILNNCCCDRNLCLVWICFHINVKRTNFNFKKSKQKSNAKLEAKKTNLQVQRPMQHRRPPMVIDVHVVGGGILGNKYANRSLPICYKALNINNINCFTSNFVCSSSVRSLFFNLFLYTRCLEIKYFIVHLTIRTFHIK